MRRYIWYWLGVYEVRRIIIIQVRHTEFAEYKLKQNQFNQNLRIGGNDVNYHSCVVFYLHRSGRFISKRDLNGLKAGFYQLNILQTKSIPAPIRLFIF